MAENRYIGSYPVIGIRPTIDGRRGVLKVRESLEDQTMNMARAAAKLFEDNLRYSNGEPVKVVIADTTIGRVAEAAACEEKFRREGVAITLTVTPCWCYGAETMDMDRNSHVCVIDATLRAALYPGENPLGQTLIVGGQRFTIVGLLSDDSSDVMSVMFSSGDNGKVILPFQAAQRMIHSNSVTSLGVYIRDTDRTDETINDMEGVLNAAFNYKDDAYRIINLESLLDTMDTMLGMMTTMLAGIASIALLVGGIGIMNMMLVSVSERTTEIGLRKALGARPKTIQMQFLLEAVMLSLLGGIIGILLGNLLSLLFAAWLQVDFELSTGAILLAFLFSATVGIIFGWAPARKASRLNPIDALRSM